MAAWRRAIELSLGEADTAKLRSIAQSRTEPASRVERARIRFLRSAGHSGCIIKRSSAASSALWPKARWLRWMIALAPVESRRSLPRPRHGWCRWRAGRRRNLAIPTNCGQRGFWPATLASMDPRRDMRASPTSPRAQCARSSTRKRCDVYIHAHVRRSHARRARAASRGRSLRWPVCRASRRRK